MHEQHQNEQYFFDQPTLDHLTDFLSHYARPCCLCTPLLGQRLVEAGVTATILDIDDRFARLPGFQPYNLYRPHWLAESFDIIICDPPFYNVSLSQLFKAIRMLAHYRYEQPLLLAYLTRRAVNIKGTFARFGLTETGYYPGYQTVQAVPRNKIEFFGNLSEAATIRLRAGRELT